MILSEIGEIANDEWLKTPSIRQDMNITLDEFVVMPDHFHAIIIIGENRYNKCNNNGQPWNQKISPGSVLRNSCHGIPLSPIRRSLWGLNRRLNDSIPDRLPMVPLLISMAVTL